MFLNIIIKLKTENCVFHFISLLQGLSAITSNCCYLRNEEGGAHNGQFSKIVRKIEISQPKFSNCTLVPRKTFPRKKKFPWPISQGTYSYSYYPIFYIEGRKMIRSACYLKPISLVSKQSIFSKITFPQAYFLGFLFLQQLAYILHRRQKNNLICTLFKTDQFSIKTKLFFIKITCSQAFFLGYLYLKALPYILHIRQKYDLICMLFKTEQFSTKNQTFSQPYLQEYILKAIPYIVHRRQKYYLINMKLKLRQFNTRTKYFYQNVTKLLS